MEQAELPDAPRAALEKFNADVWPVLSDVGSVAFAYGQGSLVSGYTHDADLDVVVVWEGAVPLDRMPWLRSLHDDDTKPPFTYDAENFFIDRFVRGGQEFNLAHHPRAWFERTVGVEVAGATLARDLTSLQVRSGFVRGLIIHDVADAAAALQAACRDLPSGFCVEACRTAINDWAYVQGELRKANDREDWLVLFAALAQSVQTQLIAVFALEGHYYPGPKWVRRTMVELGIADDAVSAFDEIWSARGEPVAQLDAASRLVAWIAGRASSSETS